MLSQAITQTDAFIGDLKLTNRLTVWKDRLNTLVSPDAINNPVWRRNILILAALGFVIGIVLSVRAQPDAMADLNWTPLILLSLFGIPITILLNTFELGMAARLIGHRLPFRKAAETTIVGSVANMLPIPGGAVVRIAALKAAGASYKHGTSVVFMVALIWIGVAFVYAGGWILVLGDTARVTVISLIFLIAGFAALAACVFGSFKLLKDWRQTTILMLLKLGLVLIDATRMFLCFRAIGIEADFGQASVLTASSVVGATVSIVPAGLGIREGVAALLGPLVGLAASSAYLSTSLNRIIGLAVTAPFAIILAIRQKAEDPRSETTAG